MTTYSASYPIPQSMQDIIDGCTAGLGLVGIVGGAIGPGADLIVIAPTWVGMIVALADRAGSAMDEHTAMKIAKASAVGIGAFVGGAKIAATVGGWLLAIPSFGLSLGLSMAGNAALNAKVTNAFGKSVARYFLQTEGFESTDLIIEILTAMVSTQFGFSSTSHRVVA